MRRAASTRYLAALVAVAAAYFATARIGLSLDPVAGVAAAVWPPSGIALAALLLGGTRLWPAVALGAFTANWSAGVPVAVAGGMMVGNTLEALAGAWLVRRFGRLREGRLDTVRAFLALVVLAGLASTLLGATLGVASAWLGGVVPPDDGARAWWTWWVGDTLGVLVFTPTALGVAGLRGGRLWPRRRLLEAAVSWVALCAVGALIFGAEPSERLALRPYAIAPPLLWAALRFGGPGAALAMFALACMAILGTAAGLGPFVHATRAESLLALQTFMGVVALTILLLGVVSTERERERAERKRLESQLVVADRLAAVGTLAAGIGHEINNPLAYVIMSLDRARALASRQLERGVEGGSELRGALDTVQDGVDRIRRIVRELRPLTRHDDPTGPVDVHRVLDASAEIAGHPIRHRARLVKAYGSVPPVLGQEGRLVQVFLNLLINAAQAIPDGRAGSHEIRIATDVAAAGSVAVEVSDTGAGIEPHLQGRLFEPFFTTKPIGEGVGLGLSVCHAIVTDLGGTIDIRSWPGGGTTFRVTLPAAAGLPARPPAPAAPEPPPAAAGLRVLIVEDETALARSLARLLGDHRVSFAASGREAVSLCAEEEYDLILCDLLMPDLTGMDVYEAIARLRPGSERCLVFMTGGAFTERAREFLVRVPNAVLYKPFGPSEVLDVVARCGRAREAEGAALPAA